MAKRVGDELADEYGLRQLAERIAARQIIPIVGSGLASGLGYLPWTKFLRSVATTCGTAIQTLVNERLNEHEYEVAADLIHTCAAGTFLSELSDQFGTETAELTAAKALYADPERLLSDDQTAAAVLLPLLFDGPVLTTALDPVLPTLYQEAQRPFLRDVAAPEGGLIHELARHQRLLVRLHGSLQVPQSRVLLSADVRTCILDDKQPREQLRVDLNKPHPNLLRHLGSMRSFVFLGASLCPDYTLEVLEQVTAFLPDSRHYALLPQPDQLSRSLSRRLQRINIEPIYFPRSVSRGQALTQVLQKLLRWLGIEPRQILIHQSDQAQIGSAASCEVRGGGSGQSMAVCLTQPQTSMDPLSSTEKPLAGVPSRSELRQLLDQQLRTDEDLLAFLLDHFPRVALQIAPRMTRKEKVSLLFTYEENEAIVRKLEQERKSAIPQADPVPERSCAGPEVVPKAAPSSHSPSVIARSFTVELEIPAVEAGCDLIRLLRRTLERNQDPELARLIDHFQDLLQGDEQRLRLERTPHQISLCAQPALLSLQSGTRTQAVVIPRRAGPPSPLVLSYFPRRQVGEGFTLAVDASPLVRLTLIAPAGDKPSALVFVERTAPC